MGVARWCACSCYVCVLVVCWVGLVVVSLWAPLLLFGLALGGCLGLDFGLVG